MTDAIVIEGARKRYGEKRALDGLDLVVARGTVYGVLGPNGAGKTTAVKLLATLLRPDGGEAKVFGYDVRRQPNEEPRRQVSAQVGVAKHDEPVVRRFFGHRRGA